MTARRRLQAASMVRFGSRRRRRRRRTQGSSRRHWRWRHAVTTIAMRHRAGRRKDVGVRVVKVGMVVQGHIHGAVVVVAAAAVVVVAITVPDAAVARAAGGGGHARATARAALLAASAGVAR